ncbi:hypothetical protein P7C73_g6143, partial [Tremellales sp. Uapishka_1]
MTLTSPPPPFDQRYNSTGPFSCHVPSLGWAVTDLQEIAVTRYSLIFVVDIENGKILLGKKNRGFGTGLYHGYGGKLERGETMDDCAVRELQEESNLVATEDGIYPKGHLVFTRPGPSHAEIIGISIYVCDAWTGRPETTDEMTPKWFAISPSAKEIPYDLMWPDASLYLPPLLHSITANRTSDLLLARVDYNFLLASESPFVLNVSPSQRKALRKESFASRQEGEEELVSGWWLGFGQNGRQ